MNADTRLVACLPLLLLAGCSAAGAGAWGGDDEGGSESWETPWEGDEPQGTDEPQDTDESGEAPPPDSLPPAACEDSEPTSLFLSADDSNSQASPVLARRAIRDGRLIPPGVIRPYEFLNYADFAYPAPALGLAVYSELRPGGVAGTFDLQLGVRAPDLVRDEARAMHLVLVLDSSGSMAGPPMELLRAAVGYLLDELQPADRVSAVRLDADSAVLFEEAPATEVDRAALFAGLVPNGATDIERALSLAYAVADRGRDPTRLSRVVLFSDGAASAGVTAVDLIAAHAGDADEDGIYLMGVGLGEGFNDRLMDAVTDAGRGAYFYLDSAAEARRMLRDRFLANFELAALDVRLELVLPPGFELVRFAGEQVSTNPAAVRPQNLAPNDQMIFHQTLASCTAEPPPETPFTVRVRYTDARTGAAELVETSRTLGELQAAPAANLERGKALVAFADALTALGEPAADPRGLCAAAGDQLRSAADALSLVDTTPGDLVTEAQALLDAYCTTILSGESHPDACDCDESASFEQALGSCAGAWRTEARYGAAGAAGSRWGAFAALGTSTTVRPREGCRFAALSSGVVGEPETIPGEARSCGYGPVGAYADPAPVYTGDDTTSFDGAPICDLAQVSVHLTAPADARSFSFDLAFFSAEYPDYIGSQYNDTFYAILEAPSTHRGAATNISFDANGRAIEINNDYFDNPFHPCSEAGTGFVRRASTCWLRTSWPIGGGESFTLTFSVHDEGDAIYSSTALLDNLRFHPETAVGMTDPLN